MPLELSENTNIDLKDIIIVSIELSQKKKKKKKDQDSYETVNEVSKTKTEGERPVKDICCPSQHINNPRQPEHCHSGGKGYTHPYLFSFASLTTN